MSLNREWIAAHIPHRDRMCLLDEVIHWDDTAIRCRAGTHRDPAHPLRHGARLNVACGIEYAAQAMALHGALCAQSAGGAAPAVPRAGFLASVRHVRLFVDRLDDIEADLICEATQFAGDAGSAVYDFALLAATRPLLSGRATVILNADGAA